jgi:hypothetical protein
MSEKVKLDNQPEKLEFKHEILPSDPIHGIDFRTFKDFFIHLLEDQIANRYPEVTDDDMVEYKKWCEVVKQGEDGEDVRIILEKEQSVIIIYAHTVDRVMIYMKSLEDYEKEKHKKLMIDALSDDSDDIED